MLRLSKGRRKLHAAPRITVACSAPDSSFAAAVFIAVFDAISNARDTWRFPDGPVIVS